MKKMKITVVVLSLVLLASNACWIYHAVDGGVSHTYLSQTMEHSQTALRQVLALLPVVARQHASREEILAAARMPGDTESSFEKDGFTWIGELGLQFDTQGRLTAVETNTQSD